MITDLMDRFVAIGTTWVWLLLLATWRTLPILILVTGFGLALRRKLTPSMHALLLTIVVARLLLPISIGSPLSLHKPIDHWFSSDAGESSKQNPQERAGDARFALLPHVDSIESPDATPLQAQLPTTHDYAWDEILYAAILLIVISVSTGLIFRGVFSHVRFAIKLRSCRLIDDQPKITGMSDMPAIGTWTATM